MFDNARDRLNRAKQFAQKHHTLVACTATGVITYKFTRSATFKTAFKEVSEYVSAMENENGLLLLQNRVMLDFINLKGQGGELQDHVQSMKG